MKNIIPWVAVPLLLMATTGYAQLTQLRGRIIDNRGHPVVHATISLQRATDSMLLKATLTDEQGAFEIITSATGSGFITCSASGYQAVSSITCLLDSLPQYFVQPVVLFPASKQLQLVSITAQAPFIQLRPGRMVLHVQNSPTSAGSNAFELIQKSPGVIVDNSNNITMKGRAGVRVYLDGKMLQLNVEELAAYLQTITSNNIATIEYITQPGARYDASGNAGIIDIRLKKNTELGANLLLSTGLTQGITPKANGGINFNYRNKRLNLFANTSTTIGQNQTNIHAPRIQLDTLYDQHLNQLSDSRAWNIKAGIDYFIDRRQTIGVMTTTGYQTDDWFSNGYTDFYYNPTGAYHKKLIAINAIPRNRANSNTNVNYRFADTSGKEINIDIDYGLHRGRAHSNQPNYYLDKTGTPIAQVLTYNNTPTDIDIYSGKVDITQPIGQGQLSLGAKFSYVLTDNTLDFFTGDTGAIHPVEDRSYRFVYKEQVNAGYISWYQPWHKQWTLQAGIRIEQTNSTGALTRADQQQQSDNSVRRHYLDVFPQGGITYQANKKNRFALSYGRRIDRPNYQQLNPFEMKLDELSYVKGNAFLRPQYTDISEISWSLKNQLTITVGYSKVKDVAAQTVDTLRNYTYAFARNIATQRITSFGVSTPLHFAAWWNGFLHIWANYQAFQGQVNEHSLRVRIAAYGVYVQQTLTFGEYTAELSGWFNGPSLLGPTLRARSMGAADLGLQRTLFKKRGTISLTATDIFSTAIPVRAKTDFGGVLLQMWVRRESRTLRLHFAYRLGNNKVRSARQRQTGLETESKRIS